MGGFGLVDVTCLIVLLQYVVPCIVIFCIDCKLIVYIPYIVFPYYLVTNSVSNRFVEPCMDLMSI